MIAPAGHSPEDPAGAILDGLSLIWPDRSPPLIAVALFAKYLSRRGLAFPAEDILALGEDLEVALDEEGWCFEDLHAGRIRAFADCDARDLAEAAAERIFRGGMAAFDQN